MDLKTVAYRDGVYRWKCRTDDEFRQYEYSRALRLGWLICGILLLLGALLLPLDETFLMMLLTCGILFAIVFAVSRYILNRPGFETVPFEMTEESVRFREGRGRIYVSFRSVTRVEEVDGRLDLYTRFTRYPVYIPEEDFEPVRDLILRRVRECGGKTGGP